MFGLVTFDCDVTALCYSVVCAEMKTCLFLWYGLEKKGKKMVWWTSGWENSNGLLAVLAVMDITALMEIWSPYCAFLDVFSIIPWRGVGGYVRWILNVN